MRAKPGLLIVLGSLFWGPPLHAWESQLLPFNGGSGYYEEATVAFNSRNWRLLDFSYTGYKLGAQPLATGVPCNIFNVVGSGDITTALQTAITNAQASGGIVRIPAGTFTLSAPLYITASNVSIEGAGSNATFINVPAGYTQSDLRYEGLFTFGKGASGWNKGWIDRGTVLTDVTAVVPEGQQYVDVADASGINVNDWIVVRQYFWPNLSNLNSNNNWASYTGWPSPTTAGNRSFSFTYLRQVLSKAGNRLNLDAPIPWRLDPANNPVRIQQVPPSGGFSMKTNVGVAGLSITFADNFNDNTFSPPRAAGAAVHFEGVRDGWVYDLVIRNFPRFAIQGESAARITVLDTAVYDCQDDGGDGYGYGFHWNESQQVLVKRSYAERLRHAYISQHPLSNLIVFTQNQSREVRLGDDSHHSFVHGYLFDNHRSFQGSGARMVERGSTSSNAYECLGSGVFWNFEGDNARGGGADGGAVSMNPSFDGWGMVVGGPGGTYKVFDGNTNAADLVSPAAGFQVGPTLQAASEGSKDRNVLYEGLGQTGLSPASLYEAQLLRRLGAVVPDFASSCSAGFSRAPVVPTTYAGAGTLIYDSDHLGWVPALGGGCDPGSTSAGGTKTIQCWADNPAQDHTSGTGESAMLSVPGVDWNILMDFTGTLQARNTYTSVSFWAYSSQANTQLRLIVAERSDGSYSDVNSANTLINIPVANTWTQVTVPMSSFGGGTTLFNKIQIRSYSTNAGATVYLDDILLNGGATPTPTATPTVTHTSTVTPSASPSATGSPTPLSSATFSPTSTRSSTRTPSPSPSASASPTPTAVGTWGAEKQLDAFKATSQIFSGFQPAGAGSGLTLTVDSGAGNYTEGGEAVRADIGFTSTPGFAELLRGYGSQTLDLSLQPFGLSFMVRGTVPTDTVRLMLYEDQGMDGSPFDAGDEVWAGPPQAMPGVWTKMVVPFSAFSLFAGTGNATLDLNRIYAWRLVVSNGSATTHAAQVWFDDLRQLTTRTAATNNNAVLSGSFIQLWNSGTGCACGAWTQGQWDAELQKLKDLCQDTVFVQYGAWEDNAWYQPESQSFLNFSNPTLGRIFAAAESLGMQVVVGLYFSESWNTDDKTLAATYSTPLARHTAVAGEIAGLFGASPAFGGWYIPQEVNDLEWPTGSARLSLLRNFLRDSAAAAKAAKNVPVYLAPYVGPNRPGDDLQSWWDGTLAVATDIDVLIPQDGVGTTRTDGDVDVPHYLAAIRAAALGRGRSCGVTVESFQQTDGWPINSNAFAAVPAAIARFQAQLWEAKALGNGPLVQFEHPYMQSSRGAAYGQLYTDYQTYQQGVAPCGTATHTPTASLSPSPSSTPTASATRSASPSPSPSRSATPSGSPTPTPSPSASPSPLQSPTATFTASPTALGTFSSTVSPSASPTPSSLALTGTLLYSSDAAGSFHLYRLDVASGISTQLTFGAFNDMNPQVSPDQRYAVFYSDRDGDQEIWRLDLLDLSLLQLTTNAASDYDPSWSPDGTKIVFKSNRDDGLGDIFSMNADGSGQVNLTAARAGVEDWDPVYSEDGSKIYFVSRLTGGDPASDEIFRMDADGSNVIRLTNNSVPDWYPAVNPLSGVLAFVSKSAPASDDDLFRMNADGSGRTQLTFGNGDDGDPAWSFDGARIASVNAGGGNYDLWLMNADGSAAQSLLTLASVELGPAWHTPWPSTPTRTPSPSATATPTRSGTPSVSATASVTAPATLTASPTPTSSATPSTTPPFSATDTATLSPSPTETSVVAAPTATPAGSGALEVLSAQAVPNPNPLWLAVQLNGPADRIEIRLYSPGMTLLAVEESGPWGQGWNRVPLPGAWLKDAPNGAVFATVLAVRKEQRSLPMAPLKLYLLK